MTGDVRSKLLADGARMLHTLKGSAAMLGLDDVAEMAHVLEDRFAPLRRRTDALPADVTDELLSGLDELLERLRAHAGSPSDATDDGPRSAERSGSAKSSGDASPAIMGAAPSEARSDDASMWRVASSNVMALKREVERLRDLRLRLDDRRSLIKSIGAALGAVTTPANRLEVSAIQSSLLDLDRALRFDAEIAADVVESLDEGVKTICTEPASTIIEPLRRLVRDTCIATQKAAALSVVGAEIGLDRRLLERLGGALAHLIRNAIDHGIEEPSERERRGKHREGALVIRIEQQGNLVLIEVLDDGAGIDVARLREAALARGHVTEEWLAKSDSRELERLVFLPGVSTSRALTATSGRGVGMDAVRDTIDSLGGQIDIETIAAQGTRFLLTVPAEFGSSPILVVRSAGHELGVPMLLVERVLAVRAANLRSHRGAKLVHGDEVLPLRDLGATLGLREPRAPGEGQPALVVAAQEERFAVLVDVVVGHLDLVVRPLPAELRDIRAYQGVATVASGQPLPIIRAEWFGKMHETTSTSLMPPRRRALVIDDSLTARAMHRAMLEAGGFGVHAVGDGATALLQLQKARYDVIVCDVAMEPMTGLELAARVRAQPSLAGLPLVLVSTRDAQADREKALAAGADAFVSKNECVSGKLLDAVESCIAQRRGAT